MAAILAILGTVVTPVTEAGKALVVTIKRQASYLLCYRSNVDDLSKEVENLVSTRNDAQGKVDADRRVITNDVQKWLEKVEDVKEDAKSLDGRVKESIGCFDLHSRYRLGKEAKKKMYDVCRLQTEVKSINVSYPPRPPTFESLPARGLMPIESTEFPMKQVMDAMKNENINMIGVYGMGGVGKTTLMKQVAKKVKSEELFHEVIMVTLTQKLELKTIQGEIAEKLGLKLDVESQVVRARKLFERLKQELLNSKKILLIFDNLWERLELDDLGIPLEWNDSGCKIAFTTRKVQVCSHMKSQAKIPVNVLSEEEAWHLFKENAGDAVDSSELHVVARKVVEECGGLPLAIVTVGMALYEKDKKVWDDALIQLQSSNPTNIKGMDKVFSSLEMSFNNLESKEAQLCFLFCCLFPEGYSVDENEMAIYGIGEGLFKYVNTLEEASGVVHMLFDTLKASCLLLEGDRSNSVKMHDVVRDVAVSIASRAEHGFLVRAKAGLKEWPEIENVQECKRISLIGNEICRLPNQIECHRLLTLTLNGNHSLKEIPNGFFQGMNSLKVLDMCGINISMLPPSLECLKNLRTLWLDRCPQLKDVSLIGGLKKLKILCLKKTGICELTEKMGELENLKLLDLMNTGSLEMVTPDVISRMTRLEELRMGNSFGKWEVMGNGDTRQASLAEMASLSQLTVLYIHVENVKCLSQDIPGPWKNLKKFCICVGRHYKDSKAARSIKIGNSPCPNAKWVEVLFNRTYELELVRCEGLNNLVQSDELRFSSLEVLLIKECGEMEHFVSVKEEETPRNVFKHLKELTLDELMNLKTFCGGPLPAGSFQNLRKLNIFSCNKLINIMPSDLLQSLEKLVVRNCCELVEVFHFQGTSKEDALLSKLRELELYILPELTTIWKGAVPPLGSLNHLEDLNVTYCKRLRYLVSPALAQRLQQLKQLSIRWCGKMEKLIGVEVEESTTASLSSSSWSRQSELTYPLHSLPHGRMFRNLQTLDIYECDGLQNLFSLSVAQGLLQLEYLSVSYCRGMEVIIAKEADDEVVDQGMLPRLRTLILQRLEQLTSFYQGVGVLFDWPSLEQIVVVDCQNFKKIQMGPPSAPNLKIISSTKEWLEEVEWEDESLKARILPLIHLVEW